MRVGNSEQIVKRYNEPTNESKKKLCKILDERLTIQIRFTELCVEIYCFLLNKMWSFKNFLQKWFF